MRKLKLRGRRSSAADSTETLADEKERRTTPEGDDSLATGKSASETDLTEASWKSEKENLKVSIESAGKAVAEGAGFPERTKSLEDIKSAMPAYGELVLDPATVAVT